MFHPVNCRYTKNGGSTFRVCRCEKKTPPKWGKELKETFDCTRKTANRVSIANAVH